MNDCNDLSKVKESLEGFKNKVVVLLGRYKGEHKKFLENIKTVLEVEHGYVPILLEEIYQVKHGTPRQVVHNIISGCSFVIADDTVPSGE